MDDCVGWGNGAREVFLMGYSSWLCYTDTI